MAQFLIGAHRGHCTVWQLAVKKRHLPAAKESTETCMKPLGFCAAGWLEREAETNTDRPRNVDPGAVIRRCIVSPCLPLSTWDRRARRQTASPSVSTGDVHRQTFQKIKATREEANSSSEPMSREVSLPAPMSLTISPDSQDLLVHSLRPLSPFCCYPVSLETCKVRPTGGIASHDAPFSPHSGKRKRLRFVCHPRCDEMCTEHPRKGPSGGRREGRSRINWRCRTVLSEMDISGEKKGRAAACTERRIVPT